ncbi:hypothetical protein [Bradyrhizobium elkanii]|uniref:hypothetical protein n=1 Tax=Bradyrhizobium elkanii TaxID=29448 RepID=UPI0004B62340|nr:hypothetical protein [Bradyrhizobium elkanii]WLA79622.1 hypothetical protein QNJ99_30025 [Bradyrhizobium elkanii]
MTMLNAAIRDIPLPPRLARRPVNERGFPVPWFASLIDGKWDFVNLDPRKIGEAYRRKICWLCGEPMGQFHSFAIGPMCSINRVSSEPSAHLGCCEYAVRACPFLARPNAKRNDKAHLAPSMANVPGVAIEHNPGAVLIWTTRTFKPIRASGGTLFSLGEPTAVSWWAEGRTATRAEIDAAIAKGLPFLRRAAESEGAEAVSELEQYITRAAKLLPQGSQP